MNKPSSAAQPTRIEQWIALVVLTAIVVGCFFVLRPFLTALLWALILCCTTWPAFNHLRRMMGQRSTLAALVMTFAIALVLLAPFVFVGLTLAENANDLLERGKHLVE